MGDRAARIALGPLLLVRKALSKKPQFKGASQMSPATCHAGVLHVRSCKIGAGLNYARGFGLTIFPSQSHKFSKEKEPDSSIPMMLVYASMLSQSM